MNKSSAKIKVNFIVSHKGEIFMSGPTPNGEKRLFDEEFWEALEEKVIPNFIRLHSPFQAKSRFMRIVANVIYHFRNYFIVKKNIDRDAVSHIFFGEEAVILRFLNLKKVAVTCLDVIPISLKKFWTWYYLLFYRFCIKGVKKAGKILTVSEYSKADIIRHLKVVPEKIKVAYWGINKIFRPLNDTSAFRRKFGLHPAKKYLVSVGALDQPRKNLDLLVKIFPDILQKLPDTELIIAGYKNDTTRSSLLTEISAKKLENKIHVLEKINDEDLCALYNCASVFVFPTLYEGFGLPPVEAMACGAPVVASSNSSLPEAVGDAGILADPQDPQTFTGAIVKILTDEKLRRNLIEKGFAHSKKFTWKACAQATYQTYLEL